MEKPHVLIVGAGALGMTIGYHLQLSGADISFLVRPGKVPSIQPPLMLYCYDDNELKAFNDYHIYSSVNDIQKTNYDFALVTLDGASCQNEEGSELIRALGTALKDSDTKVMFNGVGAIDHCKKIIGLAEDRIMEGTMAILSYQTDRVTLPLNPPTSPEKIAQAAIAYRHGNGSMGFMLANHPTDAAITFAKLYGRSGVSKCQIVSQLIYRMFTNAFFPTMAIFDLAGWPAANTMAQNKPLMKLCRQATKEILRLPENGWQGKLASLIITSHTLRWQNAKFETGCYPADYSAFNQFHHGGKVREQDIACMKKSLASGLAQGQPMPNLTKLIGLYEAHIAQSNPEAGKT